ncbi:hypothetical protein GCM10010498_25450 [Streptomyces cavourensis]|nr:hypothetical protein GCM10010498_25450 [Streptomyces cavourensis]
MKRTIAAAVEAPWNSGWSRSARELTRLAKADMKADMGEPSGGLVVPEEIRGARGRTGARGACERATHGIRACGARDACVRRTGYVREVRVARAVHGIRA